MTTPIPPYSDEQRAAALEALERNGGNVSATVRETGISGTTLRSWRTLAQRGQLTKKTGGHEVDTSWHPAFLEALARTCHVGKSMKIAGTTRKTAYEHRNADPEFRAAWDAARDQGADVLEDEAVRRARHGTKRPVFQGGVLVGYVQEYSDTLLIFLLKGARPARYRERYELTGKDGAPLIGKVYLFDPDKPADGQGGDPL